MAKNRLLFFDDVQFAAIVRSLLIDAGAGFIDFVVALVQAFVVIRGFFKSVVVLPVLLWLAAGLARLLVARGLTVHEFKSPLQKPVIVVKQIERLFFLAFVFIGCLWLLNALFCLEV